MQTDMLVARSSPAHSRRTKLSHRPAARACVALATKTSPGDVLGLGELEAVEGRAMAAALTTE